MTDPVPCENRHQLPASLELGSGVGLAVLDHPNTRKFCEPPSQSSAV